MQSTAYGSIKLLPQVNIYKVAQRLQMILLKSNKRKSLCKGSLAITFKKCIDLYYKKYQNHILLHKKSKYKNHNVFRQIKKSNALKLRIKWSC